MDHPGVPPMPADLTGRGAPRTGAGTGIGRAAAVALAAAGAKVGVHYNSSEAGAKETLVALGRPDAGLLIQADLTDEAAASAAVDRVVERFGRLDIVVNNA